MNIGIVISIRALLTVNLALHMQLDTFDIHQCVNIAPAMFVLKAIRAIIRGQSILQLALLNIQTVLDIRSVHARDTESRRGNSGQHACAQCAAETVLVVEVDQELVINRRRLELTLVRDMCSDKLGLTKKNQSLIQQVRAKIIQYSTALLNTTRLSPAVLAKVTEPVEARFKADDPAESRLLGLDKLLNGKEISIPTSVVEDREDERLLFGELGEFDALFKGDGEGLLDNDVFAGLKGFAGEVVVEGVGGGDDDKVDQGDLEEVTVGLEDSSLGIF